MTRVMEIAAKQLLMAGVTTTVDLGRAARAESSAFRDRINKGEVTGSRMLGQRTVDRRAWRGPQPAARLQVGFGGLKHRHAGGSPGARTAAAGGRQGVDPHQGRTPGLTPRRLPGDRRRGAQGTGSRCTAHVYARAGRPACAWDGRPSTCCSTSDRPARRRRTAKALITDNRPTAGPSGRGDSRASGRGLYEATAAFPERLQDPDLKKAVRPRRFTPKCRTSLKDWWTARVFPADRSRNAVFASAG